MMKYLLRFCFLIIPLNLIAQDFKTSAAKTAVENYKAEYKRAEEIINQAEAQYIIDLNIALANANKSGLSEEANLIKKTLGSNVGDGNEKPIKKADKPSKENKPKSNSFIINSAKIGLGNTWVDATEAVRKRVTSEGLNTTADGFGLPDPMVGIKKITLIDYTLNGIRGTYAATDLDGIKILVPKN